jgi:hypothetical protein
LNELTQQLRDRVRLHHLRAESLRDIALARLQAAQEQLDQSADLLARSNALLRGAINPDPDQAETDFASGSCKTPTNINNNKDSST